MQVEPATEHSTRAISYVPLGPIEWFFSEITPWLAIGIPPVIGYYAGRYISRISSTIIRLLCLIAFIITPIILWFAGAYADGCWPNSLGIGRQECMWVAFGLLVFTIPYILLCFAAIIGYVSGRRKHSINK